MVRCPRCHSYHNVQPSSWRKGDLLHRILLMRPYRCAKCGNRFWRPFWKWKHRDELD